jgi:hypothetical protein
MKFARWVFLIAGIYGILVLAPHYFLENHIADEARQQFTHPEFFYGFIGVGLAWQIAFLIIAYDPLRFRPMMLASVLEKFSFAGAVSVLYFQHRIAVEMFAAGMIDLVLGVLFIVAWLRMARKNSVV